jgi:hypothetical protein
MQKRYLNKRYVKTMSQKMQFEVVASRSQPESAALAIIGSSIGQTLPAQTLSV